MSKTTPPAIKARKGGDPIVCLTSYTAPMTRLIDPHADLILVVYKGRVVRDQPNSGAPGSLRLPVGHSPIQDPSDASQSGTNTGSPNGLTREKDQLWVYTIQSDGKLKGPIWRDEQELGLNGPNVLLLRRLKDEVEKAYPNAPAKQQTTP